ncbi:MAG: hypothetical protein QW096_11630, partial [Thermofilaceae archaeon]
LAIRGARLIIGSHLIDEPYLISSGIAFKVVDYRGSMGITKVSKALKMLDRILQGELHYHQPI